MRHRTGHLDQRGNVFWLQYRIEGSFVQQSLDTADRDEAGKKQKKIMRPFMAAGRADALAMVQAKLANAQNEAVVAREEANPPLRIEVTWDAYMANSDRPDSGELTLDQYRGHWDRFAKWLARAHPPMEYLRDVTTTIAGEYASDLSGAGLSPNRFNKHVSFLRLLFRVLADSARTLGNPFAKVQRKTLRTHSRRELTIEELTTILDRADGDLALLLLLGASTGLRLGDCATLTWGDVDLARGVIRRIPNKTARKGKPVLLGIPPALHNRFAAIPPKARTGYIMPAMAEKYRRDASVLTNAVKAHVIDCGIDAHAPSTGHQIKRKPDGTPERNADGKVIVTDTKKPAVVDVGFHSLRHTWVSLHAARGTPQAVIQDSVGHANPAMTRHYTHVSEATARDVARALPAFTAKGVTLMALPAPQADIREQVRAALGRMNVKNWKTVRAEMLAIVAG